MNKKQITSPCISICKTDPRTGFCYGCGRTNEEKKIWKEEKTTVIWKEENVINIAIPLTLRVKFQYKNLEDLYKIKKVFYKINIIDRHTLDEFNINNSFFKLYYYGNPKKLKTELMRLGYKLENYQGHWEIYIDD